ncbi:enoyl-CoA hydratase/isomerase family protein [Pandoraea communis]|uniref:3-hydroxyisobutyryl-CoA hydrolase n=1 Tax=Pandoraea communis TaxID=2508297 RepID=A0A5E4YSE7_9BURK|nr:enoyl-CoA hydratase/isomerase family protein [Pandoraea communis]MDM8358348.1 enoyl-CoA hydratase/isomerase family protein [Pandoraea communis]VVE51407.1 enoyl-CoA hydratase/isomerase family protein [Pandoraea communis]
MNLRNDAVEAKDEVLFEVVNGFGVITLNRPRALNAITHGMVRAMWAQLNVWAQDPAVRAVLIEGAGEKAFCAGGDVRALYESRVNHANEHQAFFIDEYRLDYLIHRYPKPYIALLDGIVMGGGMGVAQGAALRIATDRTRLAMPETGIGLFPDVGASWFLGHLAPTLARYLGLSGVTVNAADALYCGLADVWLEGDAPAQLKAMLRDFDWRTGAAGSPAKRPAGQYTSDSADLLERLRAVILPLGRTWTDAAPLAQVRASLDRHFSAIDVPGIVASLTNDARTPWAAETLALLQQRSPLSLCVTDLQLQKGRRLDLADAFRMELVLGYHAFATGDFVEGVRALLIDKDKQPRWRYATLADVPAAQADAFFVSPWPEDGHPLKALGEH